MQNELNMNEKTTLADDQGSQQMTTTDMFRELVSNNLIIPKNNNFYLPPMPTAYEPIPSISSTNTIPLNLGE